MLIPRFLLYYFNFKYEKTTTKIFFFVLLHKTLKTNPNFCSSLKDYLIWLLENSQEILFILVRNKYFIRQIIAIMQNRQNQNRNYVQTLLIVSLFFYKYYFDNNEGVRK